MKLCVVFSCCWFLAAIATRAEVLRISTYNVENYGSTDRVTPAGFRKDYPKPEAAKTALRKVLHALDADLLVLQEMGGREYLEELRRDLANEGLNYPIIHLLEGDDGQRHVALLAKQAPLAITTHRDLTFRYFDMMAELKRGLLEVKVGTSEGEITLWLLHLKSRYTDRPDDPLSSKRRAGEATAIRDLVLARFPDPASARFMVLGDFNDVKSSAAVRFMLKRGKTVISELLPASDSRGDTWTYSYRRDDTYQRVDHVLVSRALRSAVRGGQANIYDGPGVSEASDHRPLSVSLEFNSNALASKRD